MNSGFWGNCLSFCREAFRRIGSNRYGITLRMNVTNEWWSMAGAERRWERRSRRCFCWKGAIIYRMWGTVASMWWAMVWSSWLRTRPMWRGKSRSGIWRRNRRWMMPAEMFCCNALAPWAVWNRIFWWVIFMRGTLF